MEKEPHRHSCKERSWDNLRVPPGVIVSDLIEHLPKDLPAPLPPVIIDPRRFSVRKIWYNTTLSDETTCFSAEIWSYNRHVGIARNEGRGGMSSLEETEPGSLDRLHRWANSLPMEDSWHRVYQAAVEADQEVSNDVATAEHLKEKMWLSEFTINLESLVNRVVEEYAYRDSVGDLNRYAVMGAGPSTGSRPSMVKVAHPISKEWLVKMARSHRWAVRYEDLLGDPMYYYPKPYEPAPEVVNKTEEGATAV